MAENKNVLSLTKTDHIANVIKAGIKGLPWIGSSLEQLLYGGGDELRWRRLESTLSELDRRMSELSIPPDSINHSDFENLLRRIIGPLSQASNEDKRSRFRDLLINASTVPPGNTAWESARLASELLEKVEGPGLAIMAAASAYNAFDDSKQEVAILRYPKPQLWPKKITNTTEFDQQEVIHPINYEWAVLEAWLHRLVKLELITGHLEQNKAWTKFKLTARGTFLIHWTLDKLNDKDKSIVG